MKKLIFLLTSGRRIACHGRHQAALGYCPGLRNGRVFGRARHYNGFSLEAANILHWRGEG